jgi:hypothetical protein
MTDGSNLVTIRDIDVPFSRIVAILIKWSIAAIPAMIVIAIFYAVLFALLGGIIAAIQQTLGILVPEVPMPSP